MNASKRSRLLAEVYIFGGGAGEGGTPIQNRRNCFNSTWASWTEVSRLITFLISCFEMCTRAHVRSRPSTGSALLLQAGDRALEG